MGQTAATARADEVAAVMAPSRRWGIVALHVAAGAVVVVGVAAAVVRPLAPPLEPAADPLRWFDAAYLARAAAYRTPIYAGALAGLVISVAVAAAAAWTPVGRRLAHRTVERVGEQRPARAAAAVALAVVVATDLVLLPLAFWIGFIHEGVWGFRTQGLAGWARDWLIGAGTRWLAVGAVALLGWWLARRLPRAWPPVAGLAGTALGALVVLGAPVVLEPLQFDTAALRQGPTRAAVEEVLRRAGDPVDEIVVADASRRTTKQNAYVSGLGATRRVVLYDTLVAAQNPDVVAMVLAHELAHDANGDLWRATLLGGAGSVVVAYAVWGVLRYRTARGRQDGIADPRAAAVVVAVVLLLTTAGLPVQHLISRRAEAAADLGSLELTQDPATFQDLQRALVTANLGDPSPPAWVYALWATHPTGPARLALADRFAALP